MKATLLILLGFFIGISLNGIMPPCTDLIIYTTENTYIIEGNSVFNEVEDTLIRFESGKDVHDYILGKTLDDSLKGLEDGRAIK